MRFYLWKFLYYLTSYISENLVYVFLTLSVISIEPLHVTYTVRNAFDMIVNWKDTAHALSEFIPKEISRQSVPRDWEKKQIDSKIALRAFLLKFSIAEFLSDLL